MENGISISKSTGDIVATGILSANGIRMPNEFVAKFGNKSLTEIVQQYSSGFDPSTLSDYYTKSETSSAVQISSAIDGIDVSKQLSGYVKISSDTAQCLSTSLSVNGFIAVGGAAVQTSPGASFVRYDAPQSLTEQQKQQAASNAGFRYSLVKLTGTTSSGYLTFQLQDYAVNYIELTSSSTPVKVILPDIIDASSAKRAREFIVKIKVTTSSAPSCTFVKSASDTSVGFEASSSSWQTLTAGSVNLFTFHETERA